MPTQQGLQQQVLLHSWSFPNVHWLVNVQDLEAYEDDPVSQQEAAGTERADAHLGESGHSGVQRMCQRCFSAGQLAVQFDGLAHAGGCAAVVELRSIATKWLKQLNSKMNRLR